MDSIGPRIAQDTQFFEKQITDALHQAGIQHPDVPGHVAKRPKGRFEQVAFVAANAIKSTSHQQFTISDS
jgi:hypothetical protein